MIEKKLKEEFIKKFREDINTKQTLQIKQSTKGIANSNESESSVWIVNSCGDVIMLKGAEND